MSDEKQIYTKDELEEMSRVDLRKLAVKTWGMDNKECSGTKSQALRDWIIEQQDAYEGGGGEEKKATPKGRSGKPAPKASGGRSSRPAPSGRPAPKAAPKGRGRPAPKSEPEPDDEGQNEAPPAAEDVGELAERVDALGKTIDDNHKEMMEAIGGAGGEGVEEVKETLENIRLSLYILHGLVADLYSINYEPDDLKNRVDELEAEFNEDPQEGNE
jgi:hypothetical protein